MTGMPCETVRSFMAAGPRPIWTGGSRVRREQGIGSIRPAKKIQRTLMAMQGLIAFVAGPFTLVLPKKLENGDAIVKVFTMQPEIQSWFLSDQVTKGISTDHTLCAGWCRHRPTLGGGALTLGGDQEAKSAKAESNAVTDAA